MKVNDPGTSEIADESAWRPKIINRLQELLALAERGFADRDYIVSSVITIVASQPWSSWDSTPDLENVLSLAGPLDIDPSDDARWQALLDALRQLK